VHVYTHIYIQENGKFVIEAYHVCMYTYIHTCMYVYVYICICMYVCVYVYIYIYIYIYSFIWKVEFRDGSETCVCMHTFKHMYVSV
jgi:hypothetical protein